MFKRVNTKRKKSVKTTVLGVRLNDYQREKLKEHGNEADIVRILVDELIEGKISISHGRVVIPEEVDLTAYRKIAEKKRMSLQGLLDAIAEQI